MRAIDVMIRDVISVRSSRRRPGPALTNRTMSSRSAHTSMPARASANSRILSRGRHRQGCLDRFRRAVPQPARACLRRGAAVLEMISGSHIVSDLTLGLRRVAHDYPRA